MENISVHIAYSEAIHSDTAKRLGIQNIPNDEQLIHMCAVANAVFEPLRLHFDVPIYISSFFRSVKLNKAIKGAKDSQHCLGSAMDIDAEVFGKITNKQIFDYIKNNLDFDQLIFEGIRKDGTADWVHASFINKEKNRKEVLTMKLVNGKKIYENYKG